MPNIGFLEIVFGFFDFYAHRWLRNTNKFIGEIIAKELYPTALMLNNHQY
jgi:hypothetical protein